MNFIGQSNDMKCGAKFKNEGKSSSEVNKEEMKNEITGNYSESL